MSKHPLVKRRTLRFYGSDARRAVEAAFYKAQARCFFLAFGGHTYVFDPSKITNQLTRELRELADIGMIKHWRFEVDKNELRYHCKIIYSFVCDGRDRAEDRVFALI